MSPRTTRLLLLATTSYAIAVWASLEEPHRAPTELARELVKPVALPKLWRDVTAAERSGDLAVAIATARDLMRFLPRWTDGYAHFAGRLAFDHGGRLADPTARCDALEHALAWLDEARSARPDAAAELAATQAAYVEARCSADDALASALRSRTGRDPAEIAMSYLDAAIAVRPDSVTLRERRAVLLVEVVAAAIRANDVERARTLLDAAIVMLGRVRDPEASIPWVTALRRIRPAIHGEQVDLDSLRDDPYLDALVRALDPR